MRPDKVTMAGVALTLGLYRAGRATTDIPVWQMIATTPDALRERAERLRARVGDAVEVVDLRSTVGGGSLPGETLPSVGLRLGGPSAVRVLAALRQEDPPVIGRIEDGRVVLDLRTVEPQSDDALAPTIERVLGGAA
jgi:L-seryl-tRNA(Ser) seleniumtransferase